MAAAAYDRIGVGYSAVRRPDPRIARVIDAELEGCTRVVNVGAGSGSYEPNVKQVVAVEPSREMISQRPPGAAPAIMAAAESLPFIDGHFDAALAVLTVHHWPDLKAGLGEMRRVARRVVILTWDPAAADQFWIMADYFPEFIEQDLQRFVSIGTLCEMLGGAVCHSVEIPDDCTDGFLGAYWRRPEAYLDPNVRQGISSFCQADPRVVDRGLNALSSDLESGAWHQRHLDLEKRTSLDLGYRLVVSDAGGDADA